MTKRPAATEADLSAGCDALAISRIGLRPEFRTSCRSITEETITNRTTDSFVRMPEVRRRTGLSAATIYRKMARGEFPAKVPLGANVVAWYESDVGRWVADPLGWQAAA